MIFGIGLTQEHAIFVSIKGTEGWVTVSFFKLSGFLIEENYEVKCASMCCFLET